MRSKYTREGPEPSMFQAQWRVDYPFQMRDFPYEYFIAQRGKIDVKR
jgi:hypothetical protein